MNAPTALLHATALAAAAFVMLAAPTVLRAEDEIDLMQRRGKPPAYMTGTHGYSDFTDPLGRFLDLLAAGALAEARSIQRDACSEWLATRQTSAFAGKFWVWDTEINLDTLCAQH